MSKNAWRLVLDWVFGIAGYAVLWQAVSWQTGMPSMFSAQAFCVFLGGCLLRASAMAKWFGRE
jgi:hypothetical protein